MKLPIVIAVVPTGCITHIITSPPRFHTFKRSVLARIHLAAIKLAVALVCVGLGILVVASVVGILPVGDETLQARRGRLVDAVVQLTVDDVTTAGWTGINRRLQRLVDADDTLLSIGVRSKWGQLHAGTRRHDDIWTAGRQTTDQTKRSPGPTSDDTLQPIVVGLTVANANWGQIEFAFAASPAAAQIWYATPLARLLIFYGLIGTIIYAILVIRILGVFKQTQVVPDHVKGALDTLAEGLLLLDGRSRIVFANQAFADSVRSTATRLQGLPVDELTWRPHRGDDNDADSVADVDAVADPPTGDEDPPTGDDDPPTGDDDPTQATWPWREALSSGKQQTGSMLQLSDDQRDPVVFSINATPLQQGQSAGEPSNANRSAEHSGGVLVTFRDVTLEQRHKNELREMLRLLSDSRDEIEQKNQRLEILATRDSLTGCLNRRAFFEKFDAVWADSIDRHLKLSALMIDIDHFKSVNDTYGHHIGDEVLRAVASVLRERHEDDGIVCRYGGEEFCVLLPGADVERAAALAEQTRIAITKLVFDEPAELRLTASLGISELRFDPADPQGLINQADACLYVAKREGRNRVIVYHPAMASEVTEEDTTVGLDEAYRLPTIAITALTRALSHRDPAMARHCRAVANRALHLGGSALDQSSRYMLEIASLLHRIDRLADDRAGGEWFDAGAAGFSPAVLRQIISSLGNVYLSRVIDDYLEIIDPNLLDADRSEGSSDGPAAARTAESGYLAVASLYQQQPGRSPIRYRRVLDQIGAKLPPVVLATVQPLAAQMDGKSPNDNIPAGEISADRMSIDNAPVERVQLDNAQLDNGQLDNAQPDGPTGVSTEGEPSDDSPEFNVARGVMQLQQHMTETIAAGLSDLQRAVTLRDVELLDSSLSRLDRFSVDSNLTAIHDSVTAIHQMMDSIGESSLLQLCHQNRWQEVSGHLGPLQRTCRDVQSDLLAFSMEASQNSTPPRHQ